MNRKEKLKWYANEFNDISDSIKNSSSLSYLDFLRIRNFKLQNSSTESKVNVDKVTNGAFRLAKEDKIEEAIEKLLNLEGVAIPIASTILAMKFPDKFAIIDRKVISKIGKNEWLKGYLYNKSIYKEYLLLLREKAKETGINLRDYERSLFESKE